MAKETKKNSKDKKHFFKDFKAELKKVVWPTPKQVVNNTVAVITIVLITALIVFILDFAFESLNVYGINKLKNIVPNNEVTNAVNETEENQTIENNVLENETTQNNVSE